MSSVDIRHGNGTIAEVHRRSRRDPGPRSNQKDRTNWAIAAAGLVGDRLDTDDVDASTSDSSTRTIR